MIFETRSEWERTGCYPLLSDQNVRRYDLVHVSLNVELYHLDVMRKISKENCMLCDRYIAHNIHNVVDILLDNQSNLISLWVQTPHRKGQSSYDINKIDEIAKAKCKSGHDVYLLKYNNGNIYVNNGLGSEICTDGSEILGTNMEVVYSSQQKRLYQ